MITGPTITHARCFFLVGARSHHQYSRGTARLSESAWFKSTIDADGRRWQVRAFAFIGFGRLRFRELKMIRMHDYKIGSKTNNLHFNAPNCVIHSAEDWFPVLYMMSRQKQHPGIRRYLSHALNRPVASLLIIVLKILFAIFIAQFNVSVEYFFL